MSAWLVVTAAWVIFSATASADDPAPERAKPDGHTFMDVAGWSVAVDQRLMQPEHAELGRESLELLRGQLHRVELVLPAERVARLQQVRIWLDLTHGELRSPQYHPSAAWLVDHGYSPELAKSVHLPEATYFADPGFQLQQPWAVMHELAHAYHDQVLGFDSEEIASLWRTFKSSGRWDQVLHVQGVQRPHYALTNPMEFFAEMTESYLGQNDFYPFVGAELLREEPEIHAYLQRLWRPGHPPANDEARP